MFSFKLDLKSHFVHEYCTSEGGWSDDKWECIWLLRWPMGECSLLGGVGIPAAVWHTYHSLNLLAWCESCRECGFTVIEGLVDSLVIFDDCECTGVGVSDWMGFTSTGLDRDSSLLRQSSSESYSSGIGDVLPWTFICLRRELGWV